MTASFAGKTLLYLVQTLKNFVEQNNFDSEMGSFSRWKVML